MKSIELLESLGNVKDTYVLCAEDFRQGKRQAKGKHLPDRRFWLIAAAAIMTLLLAGCAVMYILRMQNLKVGTSSVYVPTYYDEHGNVIPVESQEPWILLSSQGANMEALKEWVAFTENYDRDLTIAGEADRTGSEWALPENAHLTYGCYSQEMVDKLDEIVNKYALKLLSTIIHLNPYEGSVVLNALGMDGLLQDGVDAKAEYWDGELFTEGTFGLNMYISMDRGDWAWERGWAKYHYSWKEFFDPSTGFMKESHTYSQWDYTRKDGKQVLLVLNEGTARIYADLPEAFLSIYLDPVVWVDGEKVPMTKEILEQFAELFDLSIQPKPTTTAQVDVCRAQALALEEAKKAAVRAEKEAKYAEGYQEFVTYRLETIPNSDHVSYVLWDLNGDGVEELIINGFDILSMKDGKSYKYCDLTETGVMIASFRPCEGNVFEIWCEDLGMNQHYFYQAGEASAVFLTGVTYNANEDCWYRNLTDGRGGQKQTITEAEAQEILDSYTRIDFEWSPLRKYGQPVTHRDYEDPYASYIAHSLEWYEDAQRYTYVKMDLNGDGVEEFITRDKKTLRGGEEYIFLNIHTVKDGELVTLNPLTSVSYILEGGILEETEEIFPDREGEYWNYYRFTGDGMESIVKIVRDPYTLVWGRVDAQKGGRNVTEEEALSAVDAYRAKRLELQMKPFGEYPLR